MQNSRRIFRSRGFLYLRADAVIALSLGVRDDLLAHAAIAPERLHAIPNPILNAPLTEPASMPLDGEWFADDEVRVVVGDGEYGALVVVGDCHAMADTVDRDFDGPAPAAILTRSVERFRSGPVAEQYLRATPRHSSLDVRPE